MAKFCRECGKELEDESKFCKNCGTKIEEEKTEEANTMKILMKVQQVMQAQT